MRNKQVRVAVQLWGIFLVVGFCLTAGLAGCGGRNEQEEREREKRTKKPDNAPPGVVTLDREKISLAGIKVEKVTLRTIPLQISATGRVGFNERKLVNIAARVSGWVDKVYAFPGDLVRVGDSLASLNSPEFLSAQSEFVQAEERLKSVAPTDSEEYRTAQALFNSARSRLLLFGAGENELAALAETHQPAARLVIKSPISGTLVESRVLAGNTIERGGNLFRISDLSSLWVRADVYEQDIKSVQKGQKVKIKIASLGGRTFNGTVEAVNDVLDENTRTFMVRIAVENPSGELKPEMFCECLFAGQSRRPILAVPAAAVQRLGDEQFVFVPKDSLSFQKRPIEAGEELGDWIEISRGLQAGDQVVTEGSFILKSELLKSEMGEEE